MKRRLQDLIILIALLLLAWELAQRAVGEHALSSPLETVTYLIDYVQKPVFWHNAQATLIALAWAAAIACCGGLMIGLPLGYFRAAGDVADPYLVALFSIPKITLYPVILLIFGLTLSAKVAFGAIHGLFPVAIFAMAGVRSIPRAYLKSARTLRLSTFDTLWSIAMPAAMPAIVTGMRIGFASTVLGTLIGEMFAGTEGLGFVLFKAIERNNVVLIMALVLLIFLVASVANSLFLLFERSLHRYSVQ